MLSRFWKGDSWRYRSVGTADRMEERYIFVESAGLRLTLNFFFALSS